MSTLGTEQYYGRVTKYLLVNLVFWRYYFQTHRAIERNFRRI